MEKRPAEAGLFGKQHNVSLPLKDVVIKSFVRGCVVSTEAELVYKNESSNPMEVVFRFPLDVDMAVKGLSARISGRKFIAKVSMVLGSCTSVVLRWGYELSLTQEQTRYI